MTYPVTPLRARHTAPAPSRGKTPANARNAPSAPQTPPWRGIQRKLTLSKTRALVAERLERHVVLELDPNDGSIHLSRVPTWRIVCGFRFFTIDRAETPPRVVMRSYDYETAKAVANHLNRIDARHRACQRRLLDAARTAYDQDEETDTPGATDR